MIRGFLDGSRYELGEVGILSLACVIAPDTVWRDFKPTWKAALDKYGLKSFHMNEAMARRKDFANFDRDRVYQLLTDLSNVLGSYHSRNLQVYACTIDLVDHKRAKQEFPSLKDPEALCVDVCCGIGVPPEEDDQEPFQSPKIEYCFDQNEAFLKYIHFAWQKKRKRNFFGWPTQVSNIYAGSSSSEFALQAADLIAWAINAVHRGDRRASACLPLIAFMGSHLHFDYETISNRCGDAKLNWTNGKWKD